uniref:DDE Tnp4 domain-containing protein n=1 Tax=Anopheles dirus TaxID=7168 RepID=A0A182NVK5_9DIPT
MSGLGDEDAQPPCEEEERKRTLRSKTRAMLQPSTARPGKRPLMSTTPPKYGAIRRVASEGVLSSASSDGEDPASTAAAALETPGELGPSPMVRLTRFELPSDMLGTCSPVTQDTHPVEEQPVAATTTTTTAATLPVTAVAAPELTDDMEVNDGPTDLPPPSPIVPTPATSAPGADKELAAADHTADVRMCDQERERLHSEVSRLTAQVSSLLVELAETRKELAVMKQGVQEITRMQTAAMADGNGLSRSTLRRRKRQRTKRAKLKQHRQSAVQQRLQQPSQQQQQLGGQQREQQQGQQKQQQSPHWQQQQQTSLLAPSAALTGWTTGRAQRQEQIAERHEIINDLERHLGCRIQDKDVKTVQTGQGTQIAFFKCPIGAAASEKLASEVALPRTRTRIWARPMLLERNQNASRLMRSILDEELDNIVVNFMRLSREDFAYLLQLVTPRIRRQDNYMRDAIIPKDNLIIALRFLSSGDSYKSLEYAYRLPSTQEEWLRVADEFSVKWKFPHAIGAIDGKHVAIKAPARSGTVYYNYKQFFSVVLLAVVDANCNFMFTDIGCKGRISDGVILRTSRLYNMLKNNELQIPQAAVLRDSSSIRIPYMWCWCG